MAFHITPTEKSDGMIRNRSRDPIESLTRQEKRAWRMAEKRARREHDTEQMAALLGLAAAGGGVTGMCTGCEAEQLASLVGPAEFIIEGRRVRAARIPRQSLARLRDAMSRVVTVPLTRVGRYGPYWVLTFKVATEQLVVLAEHLTLLPDWGGNGGRDLVPNGPLATLGA